MLVDDVVYRLVEFVCQVLGSSIDITQKNALNVLFKVFLHELEKLLLFFIFDKKKSEYICVL